MFLIALILIALLEVPLRVCEAAIVLCWLNYCLELQENDGGALVLQN